MATPFQLIIQAAIAEGRRRTFQSAGSGALRFVGRELARGAIIEVGALGVRWLLSQFGIDWNPNGPDPYPPGGPGSNAGKCIELVEGTEPRPVRVDTTGSSPHYDVATAVEIDGWTNGVDNDGNLNPYSVVVSFRPDWGRPLQETQFGLGDGTPKAVYLFADPSECAQDGREDGNAKPAPEFVTEGDCTYEVTFETYIYGENGNIKGDLFRITGEGDQLREENALTRCTISPTIVYSPVTGDDEFIDPIGEDGEEKPIEDIIEEILAGQKDVVEKVNDHTDETIEDWFNERVPELDGGTWNLEGICEVDADGNKLDPQPDVEWSYAGGPAPVVAVNQLKLVDNILQTHLGWRTPTCSNKRQLRGDWVTLEFQSDERSPYGNNRLRKLLRYRSESGRELGELIDYWKDFSWSAGPVCVRHTGAWWGDPQCWATSAAEGKRVIQHAAGEAGIDPNQVGKWAVSGSNNPRFGVPGTMRIRQNKGTYCITNRLGSSGLPVVGEVNTDP